MRRLFRSVGNLIAIAILRAPFHGILSDTIVLISVRGRKTGKVYSIPVNYQRANGDIWVVSWRDRTWWKNLRGGGKAVLRLQGRQVDYSAQVIEAQDRVQKEFLAFLSREPRYTRYYRIGRNSNGQLEEKDVLREAESKVMIRFRTS
jgi:deazaflavin-dependent oxidoreductase (nitroreductase family)